MRFALEVQADLLYDMMKEVGAVFDRPAQWVQWNCDHLKHLSKEVHKSLKTSKTMRQGVANVFQYVLKCLHMNHFPNTSQILKMAALSKEPRSCTKNFLQRGGTVDAVVQACFDTVIDLDIYLGNGEYEEEYAEDIVTRPKCRNDREFEFARRLFTLEEKKQSPAPDSRLGKRSLGGDETSGLRSAKKR